MTGISIFGAGGRMGQAIAEAAALRDDVRISEHHPDVFVDFSVPDAVEGHLRQARSARRPILIGTTGLEPDHLRLIDQAAERIAIIHAASVREIINARRCEVSGRALAEAAWRRARIFRG